MAIMIVSIYNNNEYDKPLETMTVNEFRGKHKTYSYSGQTIENAVDNYNTLNKATVTLKNGKHKDLGVYVGILDRPGYTHVYIKKQ